MLLHYSSNNRLVSFLSVVSFLILTCFLVTKRFEGHCINFDFFHSIVLKNQDSKVQILSCRSQQKKVRLDYLQYKKFELIQEKLKEVDNILGLVFFPDTIKPFKVYIGEFGDSFLSNDQIVFPISLFKNDSIPYIVKSVLLRGVIQRLKNQMNVDLHATETKLTAELITHLMMKLVGITEKGLVSSKNELAYLIRPSNKKMLCQSLTRSLVIQEFCQSAQNIESTLMDRMVMQDFMMSLISMEIDRLAPLKRIEMLRLIKGDWSKFDSVNKPVSQSTIDSLFNSEQKKWMQAVYNLIARIVGPQFDSTFFNVAQHNLTLIEVTFDLDEFNFSNLASDTVIIKRGEFDFGLSKIGYQKISDIATVQELVQFQCHPPIVKDLIQLPRNIARVTVIQNCGNNLSRKIQELAYSNLNRFLKENRELGYFQVHLPSLRWLNERNAINPFILIEMGYFDHPVFHSIGWEKAVYSEESHSYSVNAAIEVVQKFRPSMRKVEN